MREVNKLTIMLPSSLTVESSDPRIKTYKVGQIARAASIFRVNEIIIYRDHVYDDAGFIRDILEYANCPPHLKRHLFPISENLRFAGVIPPLQTPSHPQSKVVKVGEYRMGFAKGEKVDIGIDKPARISRDSRVEKGFVTVRVTSCKPPEVEIIDPQDVPFFWGYQVKSRKSLFKALRDKRIEKVIFTSRKGKVVDVPLLNELKSYIHGQGVAFVFGSPKKGVDEILKDEGHSIEEFDHPVINVIKDQGTATVRVEEALIATLTIYNNFLR
ncbi:MAG: protein containing DUF171 [Candidatus Syntrophoarchaeum butanivorans]|uniref:Protein containing DUF171 n=1 Tax=Candidatus Syntropharchaeum butanivorans TaxID=1839936 RepID=A0A1F2P470_9EURY|nr:MAG: protein containing DUF171 [Candidatus Syntrophoarchaeum butanivorans]